jgi:hypothetical protein
LKKIGYQGLDALESNASSADCEEKYNRLLLTIKSDRQLHSDPIIHDMDLADIEVIKNTQAAQGENDFHLFKILYPYPISDKHPEIYRCISKVSPFRKQRATWFRIAIHVRRGELFVVDSNRMLPNSYYISTTMKIIRILEELSVKFVCELYTEVPSKKFLVTPGHPGINYRISGNTLVDPQMNSLEDFNEIPNLRRFINEDPIKTLKGMATADVLIMSRSSFSYVAAILNRKGVIIYHPFWHSPVPEWIIATENNITCETELAKRIRFSTVCLSRQICEVHRNL